MPDFVPTYLLWLVVIVCWIPLLGLLAGMWYFALALSELLCRTLRLRILLIRHFVCDVKDREQAGFWSVVGWGFVAVVVDDDLGSELWDCASPRMPLMFALVSIQSFAVMRLKLQLRGL